jgi:hypothetical protein
VRNSNLFTSYIDVFTYINILLICLVLPFFLVNIFGKSELLTNIKSFILHSIELLKIHLFVLFMENSPGERAAKDIKDAIALGGGQETIDKLRELIDAEIDRTGGRPGRESEEYMDLIHEELEKRTS